METEKDFHHLVPKCKGGIRSKKNLLLIKIAKHRAWHKLWDKKLPNGHRQPRTLMQIIFLLENLKTFKPSPPWIAMWGNKTLAEVIAILYRVRKMKKSQRNYAYH